MEDDHLHILGFNDVPELSLFGVFDGHGGDMVAKYAAKKLPLHLLKSGRDESLQPGDADFVNKSKKAFEAALMSLDAELRSLPVVESGVDQSGSTSVVTLVSNHYIVCANTGDSRAVLCRDGKAVALSHDHKPYLPKERARIEAAGGTVQYDRVNGDLAVSRALGDFVYKRAESVPPEAQAVTAFPDIIDVEREPEQDEFIIIACDGIWDAMSSQDAVDCVRDLLTNGRPPQVSEPDVGDAADPNKPAEPPKPRRPWDLGAVCEETIDRCLALGSRDNMSILVVLLQPKFLPQEKKD